MIKKIKIELILIGILILNIFISSNIDVISYNKLSNFDFWLRVNIYFKNFFINITELGNSLWFFYLSILLFTFVYL